MAFTIAQAGSSFHILDDDGDLYTTLTLPAGVTVDPDVRAQFHTIANKLVITRAPSVNLWVDPSDFTVRPLAVLPPVAPPIIAAGSGTGLTGTYYASYSYIVIVDGLVVQESPRSPLSLPVTLANDDIDWTNLVPSTEAHVNGYRLYRTVADGSAAVQFEAQQLGGNTQIAYTGDDTADAALSILPAPDTGNAPGGTIPGTELSICTVWRDRLWAVSSDPTLRDQVFWTDAGTPFVWRAANTAVVGAKGEDEWGITGFLPRRDELVIGKRGRFLKVLGDSNDNFEILTLAEGPGCAAADSCIVIHDIGYCLGVGTVYSVGPQGVVDIAIGKIRTWFQSARVFALNETQLRRTQASYNPLTDCLELHMVTGETVTQVEFSVWAAYNLALGEWVGPCHTSAFSASARGTRRDEAGQLVPIIGSDDGYLYDMNQSAPYDLDEAGTRFGIVADWRSKPYTGLTPDAFHVWGRITIHQRAQGEASGAPEHCVEVYVFVGPIREQGQSLVNPTRHFLLPLNRTRVELPRPGAGQSLQFYLQHNFIEDPDTGGLVGIGDSPYDFELWGIELPVVMTGRR